MQEREREEERLFRFYEKGREVRKGTLGEKEGET